MSDFEDIFFDGCVVGAMGIGRAICENFAALSADAAIADIAIDEVEETAAEIASGSTWALGTATQLLTDSYERSLESQLAAETDAIADATRTEITNAVPRRS